MKQCHFCTNNAVDIDYKEVETLKEFTDTHGRIVNHKRSHVCSRHQRKLAAAIKRARFLGLLPYLIK